MELALDVDFMEVGLEGFDHGLVRVEGCLLCGCFGFPRLLGLLHSIKYQ